MATILVTGGTGLVGSLLTSEMSKQGHDVIILSRSDRQSSKERVRYSKWNPDAWEIDTSVLQTADYIVNLAGAGVADERWTEERKKEILLSRVNAAKTIIEGLRKVPHKVKALVNSSAIGWYGPDLSYGMNAYFTEEASPADDYLGRTCKAWEDAIEPVKSLGIRVIKLRTGIVLSVRGGALKEYLSPMKYGVAPVMGSGKQTVSWIHELDLVRMIQFALFEEKMNGVYNAVAPKPVTNKELIHTIRHLYPGSAIAVNVPAFVLHIMLGEMKVEVLKSTTVSAKKISESGFQFLYPTIEPAIAHLLKNKL